MFVIDCIKRRKSRVKLHTNQLNEFKALLQYVKLENHSFKPIQIHQSKIPNRSYLCGLKKEIYNE